eukprot:7206818-Prymnesium_polylepis.3
MKEEGEEKGKIVQQKKESSVWQSEEAENGKLSKSNRQDFLVLRNKPFNDKLWDKDDPKDEAGVELPPGELTSEQRGTTKCSERNFVSSC